MLNSYLSFIFFLYAGPYCDICQPIMLLVTLHTL